MTIEIITEKIPINSKPYQNIDNISLTTDSEELINGVIDTSGTTKKCWGLDLLFDLSTSIPYNIDGIYGWTLRSKLVIVASGHVYTIANLNSLPVEITGDAPLSGNKIIFAECMGSLFIASGGRIIYTNGTANTAYIADAAAPINCNYVVFIDQYLIATDEGSDDIYYSEVGDPLTWAYLNFITTESNLDTSVALDVLNRNICILGKKSLEIWYNDGVTPFVRRNDLMFSSGISAKYSLAQSKDGLFWLSDKKEVLFFNGSSVQTVTGPITNKIQELNIYSDAEGYINYVEGNYFYILHFPIESKTFVFDIANQYWFLRMGWDAATSYYSSYIGKCHIYFPDWKISIVSDSSVSKLYTATYNTFTDNGETIKLTKRTGHVGKSISKKKLCSSITLKVKRGAILNGNDEAFFTFRYRTDNKIWSQTRKFSLGKAGNLDFIFKIFASGIYYTRQYEICCSDNIDFKIIDMEESHTVL